MKVKVLEKKGKNALVVKDDCDISCRDEYLVECLINYQNYMGMILYDEKIIFKVSTEVPQEVKDELLQIARKYFNSISQ